MPGPDHTLDDAGLVRPLAEPSRGCQLSVVFDSSDPLGPGSRHALVDLDEVRIGRGPKRRVERFLEQGRRVLEIGLPDPRVSSRHARLFSSYGRWILEDTHSTNGTRVQGRTITRHTLSSEDVLELGQTFLLFKSLDSLPPDIALDVEACATPDTQPGLLTLNLAFRHELEKLERLASADIGFLLLGESGTGKEVLARAIARLSARTGEFVAVNCGAIPESLIEGEMFGAKKGAFTGADQDRPGLIMASHRGTLFLDEIADLPKSSQAALLRVLEEREVRPVGGTRSLPVDLRVISATHQDLGAMVAHGDFRTDLFARLAGHTIRLPALRDRREDLGLLVGALLWRLAKERARDVRFEPAAARALLAYTWVLNVRELFNCLTAATTLAADRPIGLEDLPAPVREADFAPGEGNGAARKQLDPEQLLHREELLALLEKHKGNVSAVARASGRARMQIQRWMKRYAIDPSTFR